MSTPCSGQTSACLGSPTRMYWLRFPSAHTALCSGCVAWWRSMGLTIEEEPRKAERRELVGTAR